MQPELILSILARQGYFTDFHYGKLSYEKCLTCRDFLLVYQTTGKMPSQSTRMMVKCTGMDQERPQRSFFVNCIYILLSI